MTVYVLRQGRRFKVGFSDQPDQRVHDLMAGLPSDVELVGYVDGGRDVEKFIHGLLSDSRIGGEWFDSAPIMDAILPLLSSPKTSQRTKPKPIDPVTKAIGDGARHVAAKHWGAVPHKKREKLLAKTLGVSERRAKSFYQYEPCKVEPQEIATLRALYSAEGFLGLEVAFMAQQDRLLDAVMQRKPRNWFGRFLLWRVRNSRKLARAILPEAPWAEVAD